jgi:hypothetical protein
VKPALVCVRDTPRTPRRVRKSERHGGECTKGANAPTTFTLTVEVEPSSVPAAVRLRRALKCILRSFGVRCVMIRGSDDSRPTSPKKNRNENA